MILIRDDRNSTLHHKRYPVNDRKVICFNLRDDMSISSIYLNDYSPRGRSYWHPIKCLAYIENITDDDGRLLYIDELLKLAEREDASC